ncbi:hypothetical protein EDC05_005724 [Coemansia umbellata]|uniref:Cytochrome P450 n=1 Tax=Coemansia umbellata TaxID=1424467 RepID=A0ABQ8PEY3_9FUNG|nr:hypothetical protein EDC05_005724 [Coemansia umbellata]
MPERFINNDAVKQNIFTFSGGARVCPSKMLAHYKTLTILANIVKNYDFSILQGALFKPDKVDESGNPIIMPIKQNSTVGPENFKRDCRVVIKYVFNSGLEQCQQY